MAAPQTPQDAAPAPRRSRGPLLGGVAAALLLGAGGFYATYAGLVPLPGDGGKAAAAPLPDIAFVPLDPVVISLAPGARARHLRMTAQVEVARPYAAEVAALMPRLLDVFNGYLRAIEVAEIEDPAALVRIRAQLLRRVQMVTGEGRVRDLLITEFVLN
jgi:flagellar FliL protein